MKRLLVAFALLLMASIACLAQTVKGDWHGALEVMGQKLPLVFHFKDADGDCTMDSPNQGAKDIPVKTIRNADNRVELEMTTLGAKYEGALWGKKIVGKFTQMGMSIYLVLTPGGVERKRPQTPQPPFPYKTEELSFTNKKDGAVLWGTLAMPENVADAPLLVFISGSGQQNRDEELFEHKPFAVIADRLARSGIASFRYDDRGKGKSNGLRDDLTTEDFRQDALSAIRMLRAKGVAKKIGIIGHSEGGLIAFMIAGEQPKDVDFIVSLSGPTVVGEKTLILQTEKMSEMMGQSKTKEQIKALLEAKMTNPWFSFFMKYDPAPAISKIKCPVFALFASKDVQVLPKENVDALRAALKVKATDRIKVYEGLNHLYQHATTGMPAEYGEIEETFAEEVICEIIEWVRKQTH